MTVAPNEVVKAVVTHNLLDNVISQSVWYWLLDAAAPVAYSAIMAAIKTEIETIYGLMDSYINSNTALGDVVVNKWEWNATDGWHTGALVGVNALSDSFAANVNSMPHAVAAVATAFTANPLVRSRKSIGGLTEDFSNDSDVVAGGITAMTNLLGEWLSARTISGSDVLQPVVPDATGTVRYLLYGLVSGLVGSQRQRKPGVGI